MGWLSRRPTPRKYVEAAVTVASNLYLHTIPGAEAAPARLEFSLQDSRYRYLIFCLSTVITAALAYDEKKQISPDALIEGCLHFASLAATDKAQDYFDDPSAAQRLAGNASKYLEGFLRQWSQWPELEKAGKNNEIIDLICSMIRTAESNAPAEPTDNRRIAELALQIDSQLPAMRGAFIELTSQ